VSEAKTPLGDALIDFSALLDKHPEWDIFGCLISRDGLRINFYGVKEETNPIDIARSLLVAAEIDDGIFDEDDLHPAPFEAEGI
jgi:hypothetical protein